MRNGVVGHLQKCIDVAVARGGSEELIKQASDAVHGVYIHEFAYIIYI